MSCLPSLDLTLILAHFVTFSLHYQITIKKITKNKLTPCCLQETKDKSVRYGLETTDINKDLPLERCCNFYMKEIFIFDCQISFSSFGS